MKIEKKQIISSYKVGKKVFFKSLTIEDGVVELEKEGMSHPSARVYITALKRMLKNEHFHRSISASAADYYFSQIKIDKDFDSKHLKNALSSMLWNINYFEGITNRPLRKLRDIVKKYDSTSPSQMKVSAKPSIQVESGKPEPVPPKTEITVSGYPRNQVFADNAKRIAKFKCEINSAHKTFISSANGEAYMEAHHLVPFSKQDNHNVFLDFIGNIVALCPRCHKLLHHGKAADKEIGLKKLFSARKDGLRKFGIKLSQKNLLSYYSGDLAEEEV